MILFGNKKKYSDFGIVHFIGIGGIGLSAIAIVMHEMGYTVQGSHINHNENTNRLQKKGIKIFCDHNVRNIDNAAVIIKSTAIHDNNIELQSAKLLSIPILTRFEILRELTRDQCTISITGSHGKTTTTALTAMVLESNNLKPTVINGGIINDKKTNAYLGVDKYIVLEADESDNSYNGAISTIGVITNIDNEHTDYYGSFDKLILGFQSFIKKIPFYGFCIVCLDNNIVRQIYNDIKHKANIITYGINSSNVNIRAHNIHQVDNDYCFDLIVKIDQLNKHFQISNIRTSVQGNHNILNLLAAFAVGIVCDLNIDDIVKTSQNFQGVKRRFTKVTTYNGADIIDDYAHHPVEIENTLIAAQKMAQNKNGRVFVFIQPHRYSRLKILFDEYVKSLHNAHMVFITEVFASGEEPGDLDARDLFNQLCKVRKNIYFVSKLHQEAKNIVRNNAQPGDIFIFMGAGDITNIANSLQDSLYDK